MAVQLNYEAPSPSFHSVPCSPYLRRAPSVCDSPAPTVPDVDTLTHIYTHPGQRLGRRLRLFSKLNSSPCQSPSIVQVPSISPRTPVTRRNVESGSMLSEKEQLVPSQTPSAKTPVAVCLSHTKTTSSEPDFKTFELFSDDDSIFL